MALADTANLAVKITLDDRGFSGPLSRLQRNLGGLNKGFSRTGRGVGQLGTGLARAGTIIAGFAVGGIALATREALKFEDAFTGVRKTVSEEDLTAAGTSFEELRNQFLAMSSEMPIAATEFARLGEVAGALGVKAQDIDDFTRVTALLGVTTNLTADEAADALGRIGTILGLTGADYEHFADVLVNLGNKGASTEAEIIEITKRFSGTGRAAGLTTEEILALSSAVSSLGFMPERGGTALARVFGNLSTNIALANEKGTEFARVGAGLFDDMQRALASGDDTALHKIADATDDSLRQMQKAIQRGDILGVFQQFLEGLSQLDRLDAQRALAAAGITNQSDRDVFIKMAANLGFVNDQLAIGKENIAAMSIEASKRFESPLQKLAILRGAAIRLAIAFGDGITPAIGRAADKLAGLFREQGNLDQATKLGESIGEAIDNIDWAKVLDGARQFGGILKGALDFTLLLLKTLNALPAEIKAAGVGFIALNKLSGGLVGAGLGNIVGGIAETGARALGSRLPGIGKLFAQPVFVTNWPIGGLGGGFGGAAGKGFFGRAAGGLGGALGGGAAVGAAAIVASGAALVGALAAVQKLVVEPGLQREAGENINDVQAVIATGDAAQIQAALDGVRSGVANLDPLKSILYNLNADGVKVHTESLIGALEQGLVKAQGAGLNRPGSPDERQFNNDLLAKQQQQQAALVRMRERIEASRIAIQTGTAKVTTKQEATRTAVSAAKIAQITANHSDTARMITAIHAARPIVSVVVNAATNYSTTVKVGQTMTRSSSDPQSKYAPKDY